MHLPLQDYMSHFHLSQQAMADLLEKPPRKQQTVALWLKAGRHIVHFDGRTKKPYLVEAEKVVWERDE